MRTKFWQNYFLGKGFAKTSADLFLNSDVANGKGGVWGGIFHLLRCFLLVKFGQTTYALEAETLLSFRPSIKTMFSFPVNPILFKMAITLSCSSLVK